MAAELGLELLDPLDAAQQSVLLPAPSRQHDGPVGTPSRFCQGSERMSDLDCDAQPLVLSSPP